MVGLGMMKLLHLPAFRPGGFFTHLSQMAFPNERLINDLPVEMRECLDLAIEEGLDGFDIRRASFHRVSDVLEHLSNTRLGILKLIFHGLAIEIGKIGNWPHSGKHSVVTYPWRLRSERSYHSNAFLSAKSSKGLVVDITALQDYTTSLNCVRYDEFFTQSCFTFDGPRTFLMSPQPVLSAVSPPIMLVVSLIIRTHTKG